MNSEFRHIAENNTYVKAALRLLPDDRVQALEQAIVLLNNSIELLTRKCLILDSIRPKILDIDGACARWDADDRAVLIAQEQLDGLR